MQEINQEKPKNKYENGKIYQITDTNFTECYIGSTIQSLAMRMGEHRKHYRKYKTEKYHYVSSFALFDKFGLENCKILLLESFPCNSKEELMAREGYHVRTMKCVNKRVPGRTRAERKLEDPDRYREMIKRNNANRGEKGKSWRQKHYAKNKDQLLAQMKDYREKNKTQLQAKKNEKFECPCGGRYTRDNKAVHERTGKHQQHLTSQKPKTMEI
jgi:hypothetical protein